MFEGGTIKKHNKIKLYVHHVFIIDNCKDILPMLIKGQSFIDEHETLSVTNCCNIFAFHNMKDVKQKEDTAKIKENISAGEYECFEIKRAGEKYVEDLQPTDSSLSSQNY